MTYKLRPMKKFSSHFSVNLIGMCCVTIGLSACGSSDSDSTNAVADNTEITGSDSSSLSGGNAGLLQTGSPQFAWDAVEGADAYQLVLTEAEGNQITYNASTDSCAGGACSIQPTAAFHNNTICLLYTSPSPRDRQKSRMPSSA